MKTVIVTTSSFGKQDSAPLSFLQQAGLNVVFNPKARKLTEDEVLELIAEYVPVGILAGVEPLTENVLNQAQGLKAIARAGIGMDSVDLQAAQRLGISVTNTPDAPTVPVAELTIGMILSLLRSIHISDASIRNGGWERPMGCLLHGKTVGIVGCGRIGSLLARYLQTFDCRVLGSDPACSNHECIEMTDCETLLPKADIVSLHLPYTAQTHHFMNAQRLQQMKPGAYLVNAARGGLVDEDALYTALQNRHLAGAALDSFEGEPYTGPLKELDTVLLTAHIGSYAKEARAMMEKQAAENLISQLKQAGAL